MVITFISLMQLRVVTVTSVTILGQYLFQGELQVFNVETQREHSLAASAAV